MQQQQGRRAPVQSFVNMKPVLAEMGDVMHLASPAMPCYAAVM